MTPHFIMFEPLTDQNFVQMAMRHYDNPQCTSVAEFEEDLKRFMYIKKLFGRYKESGELRERLVINHLIVLHNVFGVITPDLLFFKTDKDYWNILATFLVYLNQMPEELPEFKIKLSELTLDEKILTVLRKL